LTLIIPERDVAELISMDEAVASVEEAFRRQARAEAVNSPRTRTRSSGSTLNAMHAILPYLGRGGMKCYMSSRKGTSFVFVLFDSADSTPLAIMGADTLGRYRTGAASGVATKFMYRGGSAILAVCGSGRQALTQVQGVASVIQVPKVRAWSPAKAHREAFCSKLREIGIDSQACESPTEAVRGADVLSTITSSRDAFLTGPRPPSLSHANICGSNRRDHAELSPETLRGFETIAVDDLRQAMTEYGDLILASQAGEFSWDEAVGLDEIVSGGKRPAPPTLFKSGGVAIEDVAVASLVYDKALRSDRRLHCDVELK